MRQGKHLFRTSAGVHTRRWLKPRATRSFSLVELLVAIAIIALLVGLLLVALGRAREAGRRSQTLATLQAFMRACEAFQLEHGMFPGLAPEAVVAFTNHEIGHGVPHPAISSTENALLHLMGGYALRTELTQQQWDDLRETDGWFLYSLQPVSGPLFEFKFNAKKFGEGPVINGKAYPPYFTPGPDEVLIADSDRYVQWPGASAEGGGARVPKLPDLVDAWGTPILYLRRARMHGPIIGDSHVEAVIKPQFYVDSLWPYTLANTQAWSDPCGAGDQFAAGSVFFGNDGLLGGPPGQDSTAIIYGWAQFLRHPISGNVNPTSPNLPGTPRGSVILVSAGADGVYFSAADGPGSRSRPIGCTGCSNYQSFPYEEFVQLGLEAFSEFDDIVIAGGS